MELDFKDPVQNILSGPKPYKANFSVHSPNHQHVVENDFSGIEKDEGRTWEERKP